MEISNEQETSNSSSAPEGDYIANLYEVTVKANVQPCGR